MGYVKMKKYCFLLLCSLLLLGACRKEGIEAAEEPQRFDTEEPILGEETGESAGTKEALAESMSLSDLLDDITGAFNDKDPEVWYYHYKNRSLVYKNGFTYRIFSDGIYRRPAGSSDWEPLYQGKMSGGHALEYYKDFLYFTLDREGEDPEAVFTRQTLWQLNLDTLECKKVGNMEENYPFLFSIYDGKLYIGYSRIGALRYDVYPLDEEGMPGEKLPETSPDFLCARQNAYSLEEDTYGYRAGSSPEMQGMVQEVIPTPLCAAMLNGCFLTKSYRDETFSRFYLSNAAGEDQYLFDACEILAVTPTGLYYCGDGTQSGTLYYYSFFQKESLPILYPDITFENFYLLTYDRAWLYFHENGRIMRMSRSTGATEVFLDVIPEGALLQYCAVDPEYFYLDEVMYPL